MAEPSKECFLMILHMLPNTLFLNNRALSMNDNRPRSFPQTRNELQGRTSIDRPLLMVFASWLGKHGSRVRSAAPKTHPKGRATLQTLACAERQWSSLCYINNTHPQPQECKRLLLECRRRLEVVPRAEVRKIIHEGLTKNKRHVRSCLALQSTFSAPTIQFGACVVA